MSAKPKPSSDTAPAGTAHWPQTLVELRDVLAALFMRRGRNAEEANEGASACVMEIARHMGGQVFYLPIGVRLQIAIRDAEIFRRSNGRNTAALAKEFGVTDRHIQRVVLAQTRLHRQASKKDSV